MPIDPTAGLDIFSELIADSAAKEQEMIQDQDEAHKWAMSRGARCDRCPMFKKRLGPVRSTIPEHPRLTIIGEAPGKTEVECKRNFVGASGDELDAALSMGGINRNDVAILNTICCKPDIEGGSIEDFLQRFELENDRRQEAGEELLLNPIEACRPRLLKDLEEADTQVELAVGGRALEAMCNKYSLNYGKGEDHVGTITVATIKNQHGAPIVLEDENKILCSSLHPAFAMRGARAYKNVIRKDIARACKIAIRGYVDWKVPEDVYLWPEIDTIEDVLGRWLDEADKITVDIETDSADTRSCRIRCIGLGVTIGLREEVIVVPVRFMDGRDHWPTIEMYERMRNAVKSLLDTKELVAHNGIFDTQVLIENGFLEDTRSKTWRDTMHMDKNTDANDLPHGLGDVTRRYLEAPMWKKSVDHKDSGSVTRDTDLHEYNVLDVLTTMRIEPLLDRRIAECSTHKQYSTDRRLAPVARDMERLGLFVNEWERGRLSRKLNIVCAEKRRQFQRAAGQGINPRSSQQLAKWLFLDTGIQPPLNPKGYEWREGDGMSTSEGAITMLMESPEYGLPANMMEALQHLLEFKKAEKLRNTYADGLKVRPDPELSKLGTAPGITLEVEDDEGNQTTINPLEDRPCIQRLHPTWKLHVTPSGRWSASPNVQAVPSSAWGGLNLKTPYVSPPGHVLVGADFEQIELRIYAVVADDALLLEAFHKDMDPHCLNAAVLMAESGTEDEVRQLYDKYMEWKVHGTDIQKKKVKEVRGIAKTFVYLELYGGEEGKLFTSMAYKRDKATGALVFPTLSANEREGKRLVSQWHQRWHTLHPETKRWQMKCARFQRANGYIAALGDERKRFFPGGPDKKNAVPNMQIQGTAGWIANMAMLRLAEAIPHFEWSPYSGVCLQVHDYIGAFVPEEHAEEAVGLVVECLTSEYKGMKFPVDTPKATWTWAHQD